jgi:carboxyl-terminal processing protease
MHLARFLWIVVLILLLTFAPRAGFASSELPSQFSAQKAWTEFSELLRGSYGYFNRDGVDGEAVLRRFEKQALSARDDQAFVAVLKTVARHFADPHFVVGPLGGGDFGVIPTVSDMYAVWRSDGAVVQSVRARSDAMRLGVQPGDLIEAIQGRSPSEWIAELLTTSIAELSSRQATHGLNIALSGIYGSPRKLTIIRGQRRLEIELRPASEFASRVKALKPVSYELRGDLGVVRINNSLGQNATIAAFDEAVNSLLNSKRLLLDLRNTPSGGNTLVARAIMGRFVDREMPYQIHVFPSEERKFGVPRKFIEYVAPRGTKYGGCVVVVGGRWTGSMGEGLMIGFDALGVATLGSELGGLLGALHNWNMQSSRARIDLPTESLFQVNGLPREQFRPRHYVSHIEATDATDPALAFFDSSKSCPATSENTSSPR